MTTLRSTLSMARLFTVVSFSASAAPALAHHAMSGPEPASPLGKLLGGAAHLLLDAGPVALLAGAALLVGVAAVAVRRREERA